MKVTIDPRRYHGTKLFGISTARRARVSIQEIVEDGGARVPQRLEYIVNLERDIFDNVFNARHDQHHMIRYRHMMLECIELADPNGDY